MKKGHLSKEAVPQTLKPKREISDNADTVISQLTEQSMMQEDHEDNSLDDDNDDDPSSSQDPSMQKEATHKDSDKQNKSIRSSKVPAPFLTRHTATTTTTTTFQSSPGAMAVQGIGQSTTPSTAPPQLQDEEYATAVAISDKELEDEYRQRILETAVQAKVLQEEEKEEPSPNRCTRRSGILLTVLLCVVAAAILIGILVLRPDTVESTSFNTQTPQPPTAAPTTHFSFQIAEYLRAQSDDPLREQPGTPQHNALQAVASMSHLHTDDWSTAYSLAVLYESTQGDRWHNHTHWYSDTTPICSWYGVICQESGAVIGLNLANNRLVGTLPWELAMLPLEFIDLHNNALVDTIPPEYAAMNALRDVDISNNWLIGDFPLCDNEEEGSFHVDCEHVDCACCSPDCSGVNASSTMGPTMAPVFRA